MLLEYQSKTPKTFAKIGMHSCTQSVINKFDRHTGADNGVRLKTVWSKNSSNLLSPEEPQNAPKSACRPKPGGGAYIDP